MVFVWFLKWFFIPHGVMKFNKVISQRALASVVVTGKVRELACQSCGATYYQYRGSQPVCTAWSCYKKWQSGSLV